jgi:hypothetical protein
MKMTRAAISMLVTVGVAAGCLIGVPGLAAMSRATDETPWQANFVPCSPAICGGFGQNASEFGLGKGTVAVGPDGLVRITLQELTVLSSGAAAADQVLEVHVGSFTAGAFQDAVPILGTITTDSRGDFSGTVDTGQGVPFSFPPGATVAAEFVLNNPGVRSDFITGFTVR